MRRPLIKIIELGLRFIRPNDVSLRLLQCLLTPIDERMGHLATDVPGAAGFYYRPTIFRAFLTLTWYLPLYYQVG